MNIENRKKLEGIIAGEIEKRFERARELNDFLSDNPEISGEEFKSSETICRWLVEEGFHIEKPFCGFETAFKASKGKGGHRYKAALLAEYDALPGIGHGCGHCTSGTISVLAGAALSLFQDELDMDVHIIGTPQEETDGAKCKMTDEGVFDNYDIAIMIHMMNYNCVAKNFLAMDGYRYRFHGKPSHASVEPWNGRNALNGAQLMLHAVDMLRQHVTPDVRLHAVYSDGGGVPNIVPELAEVRIYVRAQSRRYLDEVIKRVDKCAEGAALATETFVERILDQQSYDNLRQNPVGIAQLEEIYREFDIEIKNVSPHGSSDIGNVSRVCPTFHPTLKIAPDDVSVHSLEFAEATKSEEAYKAILTGAEILSFNMVRLFCDEEKVKALKAAQPAD